MTRTKLERITQLTLVVEENPDGTKYSLRDGSGVVVVSVSSRNRESDVLTELLKLNYWRVQRIVFERAGWKCEECGRLKPLQFHHKIFRSHGRVDTPENGKALCGDCHDVPHGRR